MEFTES